MSLATRARRHFFYGTLLTGAVPSGPGGPMPMKKCKAFRKMNEDAGADIDALKSRPALEISDAEYDCV